MLTTETASEKIATHNNNKFHQLFIRLRERIAKKEKTPSAVDVAIIGQRHQHSFIFSARSTSTERWYIFLRFLTTVKVTPLAFENLLHSKREKKSTDTPNYQRFSLSTTFYFLLFAFYPEPPPPTYNFLNCAFFFFPSSVFNISLNARSLQVCFLWPLRIIGVRWSSQPSGPANVGHFFEKVQMVTRRMHSQLPLGRVSNTSTKEKRRRHCCQS